MTGEAELARLAGCQCKVYNVKCKMSVSNVQLGWARLTAEVDREKNWISIFPVRLTADDSQDSANQNHPGA